MAYSARRAHLPGARVVSALSVCLLLLASSGTLPAAYADDASTSTDPNTTPATDVAAPDPLADQADPATQQAPNPVSTDTGASTTPDGADAQVVAETSAPVRSPGSFIYSTHLANPNADAKSARSAGFNHMWGYIAWSAIEPSPGQYVFQQKDQWGKTKPNDLTNVVNAAQAANLRLVLRLDSPPGWAGGSLNNLSPGAVEDYVYQVLHYAGPTIDVVEVFNELNLPEQWGGPPNPAAYAQILEAAYRGAKRANPSVTVVSAGPSQRTGGLGGTMEDVDWLEGLYAAGAMGSFDALGVHAYLGSFDPSADPRTCAPMCFRDLELYRAVMLEHGDAATPVYISEMGALQTGPYDLGQYQWMALPADQRGDYLVKALQMAARCPWVIGAAVFNLDYAASPANPPTAERYWFSLENPDGSPRPALARLSEALHDGSLP